jgi:hypothetical protein
MTKLDLYGLPGELAGRRDARARAGATGPVVAKLRVVRSTLVVMPTAPVERRFSSRCPGSRKAAC